jgi:dihydroxyacetone kinase
MKEGEKSTIAYLVSTLGNVSCVELEPFTKEVTKKCEELGIILDFSIFGDIYVGKPQNCVFQIKLKK